MHAPVYIVCAALAVVMANSEENYYDGAARTQPDISAMMPYYQGDREAARYLLPRLMMPKYRANREWGSAPLYSFYPLPDLDGKDIGEQSNDGQDERSKRNENMLVTPSLSITNSLDVLRNRLLLEIQRKQAMKDVKNNRNLLCKIGKRSLSAYSKRNCDEPDTLII